MDSFKMIICANPNHRSGTTMDGDNLPPGWFTVSWNGGQVDVCSRYCIDPALDFKLGGQ